VLQIVIAFTEVHSVFCPHLALAALRAASLRCSGVNFLRAFFAALEALIAITIFFFELKASALALPPRRPSSTAAGFLAMTNNNSTLSLRFSLASLPLKAHYFDHSRAAAAPLRGPAIHVSRKAQAMSKLQVNPSYLATLTFREAAPIWYEAHSRHISPGSMRDYRNCIKALSRFFDTLPLPLPLSEIHIGHFEQYQKMRSEGAGLHIAGASRINHELNTLSQILNRAGLWAPMASHYKPLPLPVPSVGSALAFEDEQKLFRIAASNPRWKVAYCCALITANTTAGPGEIRHLRIRNVEMNPPTLHIEEGVKNEYRKRSLPLNAPAAWAVQQLIDRARKNGATEPHHYLLPHRAPDGAKGFDPTRPISSWRGSWDRLREAAGMPHFRMYDLRHHAITRLLEDEEISERTVIDLAGHVSRAMLERYSHIRMRTKREAVDALAKKTAQSVGRAALVLVKR
jgi:integrase